MNDEETRDWRRAEISRWTTASGMLDVISESIVAFMKLHRKNRMKNSGRDETITSVSGDQADRRQTEAQ